MDCHRRFRFGGRCRPRAGARHLRQRPKTAARVFSARLRMLSAPTCTPCADRILLVMGRFEARSFEELLRACAPSVGGFHRRTHPLSGERQMRPQPTDERAGLPVHHEKGGCRTPARPLSHGWFVEDAEAVSIDVALHGDVAQLTLDASGTALNRRGYRTGTAKRPARNPRRRARLRSAHGDPACPCTIPCAARHAWMIEAAMRRRTARRADPRICPRIVAQYAGGSVPRHPRTGACGI